MITVHQIDSTQELRDKFYKNNYQGNGVKAISKDKINWCYQISEHLIKDWENLSRLIEPLITSEDYQHYIVPKKYSFAETLKNISHYIEDIAFNNETQNMPIYQVTGDIHSWLKESDNYFLTLNDNLNTKHVLTIRIPLTKMDEAFEGIDKKEWTNHRIMVMGYLEMFCLGAKIQLVAMKGEDAGECTRLRAERRWKQECQELLNTPKDNLLENLQESDLKQIGLVTNRTSHAYNDFSNVLNKKYFSKKQFVFPPDGDTRLIYAKDIAWSIEKLCQEKECKVICLLRGGGSVDDLAAFSEPRVLNAIYQAIHIYKKPVILGIGHSANKLLCDQVASYNAGVPSLVAHYLNRWMYKKLGITGKDWQKQYETEKQENQKLRNRLKEYSEQLKILQGKIAILASQ